MTEAEKGVILRELGTDWQGNSGFARAAACRRANKNPAKDICPRGVGRKPSLRIRSDGRFELVRVEHRDSAVGEPDAPCVSGSVGERRKHESVPGRDRVRVVA